MYGVVEAHAFDLRPELAGVAVADFGRARYAIRLNQFIAGGQDTDDRLPCNRGRRTAGRGEHRNVARGNA